MKVIILLLEDVSLDTPARVMLIMTIGDTLPIYTVTVDRREWEAQGGE